MALILLLQREQVDETKRNELILMIFYRLVRWQKSICISFVAQITLHFHRQLPMLSYCFGEPRIAMNCTRKSHVKRVVTDRMDFLFFFFFSFSSYFSQYSCDVVDVATCMAINWPNARCGWWMISRLNCNKQAATNKYITYIHEYARIHKMQLDFHRDCRYRTAHAAFPIKIRCNCVSSNEWKRKEKLHSQLNIKEKNMWFLTNIWNKELSRMNCTWNICVMQHFNKQIRMNVAWKRTWFFLRSTDSGLIRNTIK